MTPDPHPQPDHGAAGFCTDHAQPADRPTTVAEAVRAGAQALADRYGEDEVFVDRQNSTAVLEAVGYADLLAEVERLRGGRAVEQVMLWNALPALAERDALAATVARVEHIVSRYGDAHDAAGCAVLHDLRALLAGDPRG